MKTILPTLLVSALMAAPAFAKTISYTISGVTTFNMVQAGALTEEFPVGTKWSAVVEWDDASSSLSLTDFQSQYRVTRFKLTLQGKSGPWTTSSLLDKPSFTLNLPFAPGGKHELQFTSGWGPESQSNPDIEDQQVYSANILLGDPTSKAITALSPAPSGLKPSDWDLSATQSYFKLYLSNAGNLWIYGDVRSIQSNTAPEISVRQPADNELKDLKGRRDFGGAKANSGSVVKTFTIRNTGKSRLSGLALSVVGENKGDFTPGDLPSRSLAPGDSLKFTVSFRPKGKNERNAMLRIASNDEDENPFRVRLTGTGR